MQNCLEGGPNFPRIVQEVIEIDHKLEQKERLKDDDR